jgi:glycerol kinase
MQFQADVLGIPVETAAEPEQTALGAALLAHGERRASPVGARYEPQLGKEEAERLYAGWREALRRTLL